MSKTLVKTAHSEYLIDHENKTLVRTPVHEDANDLSSFGLNGEEKEYSDFAIGAEDGLWPNRLVVLYPDGAYSVSTPVVNVEKVD